MFARFPVSLPPTERPSPSRARASVKEGARALESPRRSRGHPSFAREDPAGGHPTRRREPRARAPARAAKARRIHSRRAERGGKSPLRCCPTELSTTAGRKGRRERGGFPF
ncbi:hypothetical protein AKJ64_01815 [candidate division MSBL1 archaeon SCGC-AAA259E17]|uniref:Uncharacterized protein n=1 Tax=candidate division MSBL1 archaeon SCGC-AAA259E17 TaxID=1698263 RepID=A0A133UFE0_9EURY|nr:hypothetical protein AKJ64_01815 [candidate division MSBL1 archaeon SCGC-AAA259E17]